MSDNLLQRAQKLAELDATIKREAEYNGVAESAMLTPRDLIEYRRAHRELREDIEKREAETPEDIEKREAETPEERVETQRQYLERREAERQAALTEGERREDEERRQTAALQVSEQSAEERAFTEYLRTGRAGTELRAAGTATGGAGGYLVPPGWWQRLQIAQKAYGGTAADFQELVTDTGQPMTWATNDPTSVVGSLIAENTSIGAVDYVFGQGVLSAYMYTGGVHLASFQLEQDSAFNLDAYIQDRVAESLGRAEAAAAVSGTGTGQPYGIIPALTAVGSSAGSGGEFALTAGHKVNVYGPGSGTAGIQQVTEVAANALAPDTVNALIAKVDRAYRLQGAKFYMNDTMLTGMRNVVDAYGRPLYQGLQFSETNLELNGYPVVVDNNIPTLATTAASGVIFGHLQSAMVFRRVQGAGLLRLDQRYADALQIGYIGYERIDIRPNDLRAAAVTLGGAS